MSRLPILHPDYVYKPLSDELWARLSAIQQARFAPKGMRLVCGCIVPRRWAHSLRYAAAIYRQKHSEDATMEFVVLMLQFLEYHCGS